MLAAVGLSLADLFEQRLPEHSYAPTHSRILARDLLEIISEETSVVAIIAADMVANSTVSDADRTRLVKAASRIGRARDYARRQTG